MVPVIKVLTLTLFGGKSITLEVSLNGGKKCEHTRVRKGLLSITLQLSQEKERSATLSHDMNGSLILYSLIN